MRPFFRLSFIAWFVLNRDHHCVAHTIDCTAHQCRNTIIHCVPDQHCFISCDEQQSCIGTVINGPSIKGDLTIHCNGVKSCFGTIIDGRSSSSLDITGCSALESCSELTLYCPPHTNGHKNCLIQGNNRGTQIYAINGFNDINIGSTHDGRMFCGVNYDRSCAVVEDDWLCNNVYDDDDDEEDDNNCNSYTHHNPTYNPTSTPSNIPTTSPFRTVLDTIKPSLNPTVVPTTTSDEGIPRTTLYIIHSTDTAISHGAIDGESAQSEILSWTLELQIGFALFVIIMFLFLAIYCCCKIKNKNIFKSDINEETIYIDDDVKCDELSIRNTEGLLDPYRPNPITLEKSVSLTVPDVSIVMYDVISMNPMSKESNITNISMMTNASVNDIKEKNILFLNPLDNRFCMEDTRLRNGENSSTETDISIHTNSDETSVDEC